MTNQKARTKHSLYELIKVLFDCIIIEAVHGDKGWTAVRVAFFRFFLDELTVGAAPIRSVLQPWITRIPGAENGRSNDDGLLTCNPLILNLPFRYCVLSFAILSICSYTAFCRRIRFLLLQPASALPAFRSALHRRSWCRSAIPSSVELSFL